MNYENRVTCASFSPDGKNVLTASLDGVVRVWDSKSGAKTNQMTHAETVGLAGFSDYSGLVLIASGAGIPLSSAAGRASGLTRMNVDHYTTVETSEDGLLIIRDVQSPEKFISLAREGWWDIHAAYSADGERILTTSWDGTVRIWDASSGRAMVCMSHEDHVFAAAFSPDGSRVVTSSRDRMARILDPADGRVTAQMMHKSVVSHAAFSPDGRRVVTASWDDMVTIWDAMSGVQIVKLPHDGYVDHVAFSPDGRRLITITDCICSIAINDSIFRIWDIESIKAVALVKHTSKCGMSHAAFSPDGRYVVTASSDGTARVWSAKTGAELACMLHDDSISHGEFSPDGRYVVTGSADKTARIWLTATGTEVARMAHDDTVRLATLSPDGNRVVTVSGVNTTRIWDAETGAEIARMAPLD